MAKQKPASPSLKPMWFRVGSHRFEFFATDEEVEELVSHELPEKFAPNSLITTSLLSSGDKFINKLREHAPNKLRQLIAKQALNIHLRSEKLTPDLAKAMSQFKHQRPDNYRFQLGFAGLIIIQPGASGAGSCDLTMVDKLRHYPTNKEVNQNAYVPLYNAMKRLIRKKQVVWAWYDYGKVKKEFKRPMLTVGLAAAIRDGSIRTNWILAKK